MKNTVPHRAAHNNRFTLPPHCALSSLLLLPVILIASCANPAGGGEGNVIISLPQAGSLPGMDGAAASGLLTSGLPAARNVKPGAALAPRIAYTITCTGPGGVLAQSLAPGVSQAVFRLALGKWTVTASGTVDGVPLAHGGAVMDVTGKGGQRVTVNLDFYTEADFDTDGIPLTHEYVENIFAVRNLAEWNDACAAIAGGGDNKNYIINVTEAVSGVTGLSSAGFNGVPGGGSLTVGSGALLNIGAGQTVILRDIELRGKPGNTTPVVYVDDGALAMYAGAKITGNTTSGNGGGVYVTNGSFTKTGNGVIYGDTDDVPNNGN
ncbi:MAG: hypothetical protein LBG42_00660, partial [Treponema sp.]|nr:hypothetical protein [Treponema sp.]